MDGINWQDYFSGKGQYQPKGETLNLEELKDGTFEAISVRLYPLIWQNSSSINVPCMRFEIYVI